MVLAPCLSWDYRGAVAQGYKHLEAQLGLVDPLPHTLIWLLASFSFLLAVARLTTSVPCHVASPLGGSQHGSWLPHNEWFEREKNNQNRSCSVFYNLISEVRYHHFCILLVAQTNPSTRWERIHKGANTRRQGPLDIVLEAGYHSCRETLRPRLYTSFIKELTLKKIFLL